MNRLGQNWIALLCAGVAFVFLGQTMLCFAADAGVIPCIEQADHHAQSAGEENPVDCCHCSSHQTLLTLDSSALPAGEVVSNRFLHKDDSAPDGPVSEIDHPPQLS